MEEASRCAVILTHMGLNRENSGGIWSSRDGVMK